MRKVILLTGFSNWGKTFLIKEIFNRKQFRRKTLYPIPGISNAEFCVQPQSNDDWNFEDYKEDIKDRLVGLDAIGKQPKYIFSAFCPTREDNNLSCDLIKELFSHDEVYLIPIEAKWCGHAHLDLAVLDKYFSPLSNVQMVPLKGNGVGKGKNLVQLVDQCI